MLSENTFKELSLKYQTREDNIIREYLQHLFLSFLYNQRESENLYFKGGTALRIIYHSPRFSKDLDFSAPKGILPSKLDNLFLETINKINNEGVAVNLKEAENTSGGYLGIFFYQLYNFQGEIQLEISLRKKNNFKKEITTIVSDFLPPYVLIQLASPLIVEEKIIALENRHKPRDYYDLYFILRHSALRNFLEENSLKKIKKELLKTQINFKKELEVLLPISHHQILKNFKSNLLTEIEKF